ncbi:MAG: helix-turn-helix domain-containing protein [Bifidobacteriaceae bacterium]|nr:helix-turn-helix domain-containing protein [Bifidobacteriaceae bacterium]
MTGQDEAIHAPLTRLGLMARREALGLNQSQLGRLLGVSQVTISTWEHGRRRGRGAIPPAIGGQLLELEAISDQLTALAVEAVMAADDGAEDLTLRSFLTDEDLWDAHPELEPVPAAVHRVAMAAAARRLDREHGIAASITDWSEATGAPVRAASD